MLMIKKMIGWIQYRQTATKNTSVCIAIWKAVGCLLADSAILGNRFNIQIPNFAAGSDSKLKSCFDTWSLPSVSLLGIKNEYTPLVLFVYW